MTINRAPHDEQHPFTRVTNQVLKNKELSARAMGLFCYMLSAKDDWRFYESELFTHFTEGRDALRTTVKELEHFGYIQKESKKFAHTVWIINEIPKPPLTENPSTGETPVSRESKNKNTDIEPFLSLTGNPSPENPPLITTNITTTKTSSRFATTRSRLTATVPPSKNPFAVYTDNRFGQLNSDTENKIGNWILTFENNGALENEAAEIVARALQSAANKSKSWNYVAATLEKWNQRNCGSLDAVRSYEQEFMQEGFSENNGELPTSGNPETFPNDMIADDVLDF